MRDVQRGAVVVAGVVLQDDHRAGAALLGAYVGVEVGKVHVAPAVNPVFLHAVSPFLSFVSFDIPQSEKAGHVRISLAVVSVLCVHIASPCLIDCFVFRVCPLSICPRRPESRENIRRRCAAPLHRNLTSLPSLWPGRELRKYHYPCVSHGQAGSNPALAGFGCIARSSGAPHKVKRLCGERRSSVVIELSRLRGSERYAACSDEVVALRLPWLVNNRNVPDAWIFSFQSALSCVALRKPNLHIPLR